MDERKSPPQIIIPESDSKLPAVAAEDGQPSKRLKTNEGSWSTSSAPKKTTATETIDVAAQLNFISGTTRIEVKWTINDDDDSEEDGGEKENAAVGVDVDGAAGQQQQHAEGAARKSVQVWWPATLIGKTNQMHVLTDEEREESDVTANDAGVKLPIYRLNYSPLQGE